MRSMTAGCEGSFALQSASKVKLRLNLAQSRSTQFALLLIFALLIRFPTFGEWNYDIDEQFYALVGQGMLDGATLYLDIWDRKPPALYLTYALIGLVSREAVAWQIAATVAAALGAFGINRVARLTTGPIPAIMAAIAYLALLNRFGGGGGQAPVFYNPLMLLGAWSILTRLDLLHCGRIDMRVLSGVAAAGLAITFKQSAVFEATFFGLFIVWCLLRSGAPPMKTLGRITLLAFVGVLPMALTITYYGWIGHLPQLWQALVGSNLVRVYPDLPERLARLAILLGFIGLPLVFAMFGFTALWIERQRTDIVTFLLLWSVVAIGGVAAFPNVYLHYSLPLLPPLCILAARFYARPGVGRIGLGCLVILSLWYGSTLNLPMRWKAHKALGPFVDYVARETPNKRLLLIGMQSFLYAKIGAKPPSVLAFPPHLYEGAESGVSGIDEVAEMRRILATRPETVILQTPLQVWPLNERNLALVNAYVRNCDKLQRFTVYDHNGEQPLFIYSDCGTP